MKFAMLISPNLKTENNMENNQLQLVTFEQAQRLKKSGFDWPTTHFYVDAQEEKTAFSFWQSNPVAYGHEPRNWNTWEIGGECGNTSAPTVALALKRMRDVKGLHFSVYEAFRAADGVIENYAFANDVIVGVELRVSQDYNTFEQAESALLDELLTLIEK